MGPMVEILLLMLLSHVRSESWTLPSYRIHGHPHAVDYVGNAQDTQYQYFYRVHDDTSGVELGHQESRRGHHTQGSYHVRLPDGRLQRVAYTVSGDSGFRARVFYEAAATRHSPETSVNTITSSYDLIPTLS
ncbi:larval cuticle protein A2B-like [Penaeus vannamei]|uniref:larval cuticle protein A2B-like n=1 Tax=Penaeus vannamei TaxID=6689 RepID=UPI00387F5BE0